MRIAAISDLHIGPTSRIDAFGHSEDDFLLWLDRLEEKHDKIVLLGDIYQSDQAVLPGQNKKSLYQAQERLLRFYERCQEAPYQWVHGNHDANTREEMGAHTDLILGDPDFSVLFTHGDRWDPLIQGAKPVSIAGTWLMGRLRAAGARPVAEYFEARDVSLKAQHFQGREGPYVEGARKRLGPVQAVVLGHTHVPFFHQLPEGMVANTGTCSRGQRMGVSVDTGTGEIRSLQGQS